MSKQQANAKHASLENSGIQDDLAVQQERIQRDLAGQLLETYGLKKRDSEPESFLIARSLPAYKKPVMMSGGNCRQKFPY